MLSRLADNSKVEARMWVAACEYTPISILKKLASDENLRVRTIVSLQPAFSLEWLDSIKNRSITNNNELISHQFLVDYLEDYCKPLSQSCLKLFTQNKNIDLDLRIRVIQHNLTPASVVKELADSENSEIRKAIARNSNTSIDVLETLAKDRDDSVREAVAASSMTPRYIRQQLARDRNLAVRQAVKDNQYFHGEDKDKTYFASIKRIQNQYKGYGYETSISNVWEIDDLLNSSETLKYEYINKLAEDRTPQTKEYRKILAESIDTPVEILERLVTSPEINIRYCLAKRNELEKDILDNLWLELIEDPDKDKILTRSSEFFNTYLRVNLKLEPEVLHHTLVDCIRGESLFARFIALSHPLLPDDLFHSIVKSTSWLERYALTQNPKLPDEIREFLRQDANKIVRAAACDRDKIFTPSSGDIIPNLKASDRNLVSTLNVLTKELQVLINDPEHWEKRIYFEVIFWENQKKFSLIDCLNKLQILQRITIPELLKSPQEQTIGKYVKLPDDAPGEYKNVWVEPSISEESIDRCQLLLKWLQTDLKCIEIYQVIFCKREEFQILIGQTQQGEWIGITVDLILENDWQPLRDAQNYNLDWFIRQVEILIEDIDFSGELCDRNLLITNDWQIDINKDNLIKKLLVFAEFITKTKFKYSDLNYNKVTNFLELFLTNIESYRMGEKYSGYVWYCEDYTWGMTPGNNWLILKTRRSG